MIEIDMTYKKSLEFSMVIRFVSNTNLPPPLTRNKEVTTSAHEEKIDHGGTASSVERLHYELKD